MTNTPPSTMNLRGAVDLSSLVRPQGGAAGAAGDGGVSVHSLVLEGTDANFTAVLELSSTVPVVVELHGGTPSQTLVTLVREYAGRFVLASVLVSANPQLAQAFRAVNVPTVAAVVGGRPIALYEGELPEAEARAVLEQLAALAAQNGVTGRAVPETEDTAPEPAQATEEPLSPHHQAAYDAISAKDYPTAIAEYQKAIAQNPRDDLAVAGLAQVSLLYRLEGKSAGTLREAAAVSSRDAEAQLAVADLDVAGGHLEDAFGRLLDLFPALDAAGKEKVRARLLEYFEIAGAEDPRVIASRRRLAGLLY